MDTEWQRIIWELEAIELELKRGASDTPDNERYGSTPLTPEEKKKLTNRQSRLYEKMNAYMMRKILARKK